MIYKNSKEYYRLSGKKLLSSILLIYYLSATIMPVVSQISGGKLYMGLVVLMVFLVVMRNKQSLSLNIKFILPFLPLGLLNLITLFAREQGNLFNFIYSQLLLYIPAILCFYLLNKNSKKDIKWILYVISIAYLITAFTTYLGLKDDPSAARFLATVSNSKDTDAIKFNMKNIGGYTTVYSVALILPMIICIYKQKKIRSISMLLIISIVGFYILSTQYATAFIMFMFSLTLFFFPSKLGYKKLIILCILILSVLIFVKPWIVIFLDFLTLNVKSYTLAQRFMYLSQSLSGIKSTSDVDIRKQLLMLSLDSFIKNPLFGVMFSNKYLIGGHSFVMDTLASYGLFGVTSLVLMYRQILKKFYFPFKGTEYYGYMIISFIQAVILSTVNTGEFLFVIAFIIPLIGYALQNKDYRSTCRGANLYENFSENLP